MREQPHYERVPGKWRGHASQRSESLKSRPRETLTKGKVDEVKLVRRGEQVEGTLHLTPHHLIFCHTPNSGSEEDPSTLPEGAPKVKPKELWITYPIIQNCTLRPSPPASHLPSSIRLRCRDFTFVCFCFNDEKKARDVYDSIKAWTCKLGRVEKLYAFSYQPPRPEKEVNGWDIYDARKEWKRQGISDKSPDKGWRISRINTDYGVGLLTEREVAGHHLLNLVLSDLSRLVGSTYRNIRQYLELCWPVQITSSASCSELLAPSQQLFHNSQFTTTRGRPPASKYTG